MRFKLAFATLVVSGAAQAQPTPSYGLDFVSIGSVGNRAALPHESPFLGILQLGDVDYAYRISRTEITVGQWLEFANAYAPYHSGNDLIELTGFSLSPTGNPPGQGPAFEPTYQGSENWPADMGWRYAARYANWLHNGKAVTAEAFESGAYDTSTFGRDPQGRLTDQLSRSPGAKFWIPSWDEWAKAAYFDPDRYGTGEEGYWLYPDEGLDTLVGGLPGTPGAETNAGILNPPPGIDVGSYPGTVSPWGLLDLSGGQWEWTETPVALGGTRDRVILGSELGGASQWDDVLGTFNPAPYLAVGIGVRIASVPAPGPSCPLVILVLLRKRIRP